MTAAPQTYACELREMPARHVLTVHFRSPVADLPGRLGDAYRAVFGYLAEMGAAAAGPPFAAYHNMDMADLDVEGGCPVRAALPGRDAVQPGIIPAGKRAVCLHVGPYTELQGAYHALMGWMQAHGYEGTGVAYEFYLNDPADTPPHALRTEIEFPVMPV